MPYDQGWAPYVSVAERRRRALKKTARLRKRGMDIRPIEIEGRKITKTFWGQAWCDHMESLGDYENRLPRGRSYVRNGSVCHLAIDRGQVTAMVSGSSVYNIKVKIGVLPKAKWNKVKACCAGKIGSLLELLQGRLSNEVMGVVTDSHSGLFPLPDEIRLSCSCPDWATMCKHVAAVLYGVGARLDEQPDLLFLLRGVKHEELIDSDAQNVVNRATRRRGKRRTLASGDLSEVFGIELDSVAGHDRESVGSDAPTTSAKKRLPARKRVAARKKSKPVTTRHKKPKAGKKATPTKKSTAKSMKKKAAKKKPTKKPVSRKTSSGKTAATSTAKKKAVSNKPKQSVNKKTATKPTAKKATPARTSKKKIITHALKKAAAKKRATKRRPAVVKKTATRKKAASKT